MFCVVYVAVFVAYCECKEFLSCCRYCLLKLACSCETHRWLHGALFEVRDQLVAFASSEETQALLKGLKSLRVVYQLFGKSKRGLVQPDGFQEGERLFRAHSHCDITKGGTQGFPIHEVSDKQEVLFEDYTRG